MFDLLKRLTPGWLRNMLPPRLKKAVKNRLTDRTVVRESLQQLLVDAGALRERLAVLDEELALARDELTATQLQVKEVRAISGSNHDRIPELRQRLLAIRSSADYEATFAEPEPLVSVRIATYNRPGLLLERAIPSVLGQTYPRLELIIVGDGCDDDTVERVQAIKDPRVRFINLPHRGVYPEIPVHRWMVAGAPAMNTGALMARGRWIAPLDDDDEFTPGHIEVLLERALADRFEMVYGKQLMIPAPPHEPLEIGEYPPREGHFGFQAAIYMSALRFFEYDSRSWTLNEPADWNLGRRMLEAGVRIGWIDRVVNTLYQRRPGDWPT